MSKTELLIIDDEPQIRRLLQITLESNDYKVRLAENAKQGMLEAAMHPPDLILLDIGLPDLSGQEVLKELRAWYNQSIIILSVLNNEADIVTALDNGASDYLTKPFRSAELLARIRAAIRRNNGGNQQQTITSGELQIDLFKHSVSRAGHVIKLTQTEFNLLALLARNQGRVLTHQYLLKEIWGIGHQTETQYLRVFIGTLRKKIEADANAPENILTENGIGYRFV